MASHPKTRITQAEYLAMERTAPFRSEYFQGEVFAMTGASRRHNIISLNVAAELNRQLADKSCEVYASDMRVGVPDFDLYTYPDVVVVCGDPVFEDQQSDTLINPTAIVEVLSKSTEGYDRGAKFEYYRSITSLAQVLLIAQDKVHIESFIRQPDDTWLLSETSGPKSTITLSSISCSLSLVDVYRKVTFEA